MKKKLSILGITGLLVLSLAGCGGTGTDSNASSSPSASPSAATTASSDKVTLVGSTSVGPLAKKLQEAYQEKNPNVTIEIQEVGSSAGIEAAISGTADIGMSSRDLKDEETSQGVQGTEIALDGIAVVVNPENPVQNLTQQQVSDIFQGKITNWSEVGGEDADIVVVSREAGSGTRGAFEEIVGLLGENDASLVDNAAPLIADSNGSVKANITGKKNAIGYLSYGIVDDTVKALQYEGVDVSVENIKNDTYKLARPFLFVTKGEATGAAKEFMDFVLSAEGQEIVTAENYIDVH